MTCRYAAVRAGNALRDRDMLSPVRRQIAFGLPAGGDPGQGPAAVTAVLALDRAADSAGRSWAGRRLT